MLKVPSIMLALTLVLAAGSAAAASTVLEGVMKEMGSAATNGDTATMVSLFDRARGMQPNDPAFAGWSELAEKGARPPQKGDLAGAKATCKGCHDKFRHDYKTKYGSKAP